VRRSHGGDARPVLLHLLGEQLGVGAGGKPYDMEPTGMGVDDGERAAPDGAGRAEDGNPCGHGSAQRKKDSST
jgi:hypothetical protein